MPQQKPANKKAVKQEKKSEATKNPSSNRFMQVLVAILLVVLAVVAASFFLMDRVIGKKSCEVDGVSYKHGEPIENYDSCNSCSCNDGEIECTDMACGDELDGTAPGTEIVSMVSLICGSSTDQRAVSVTYNPQKELGVYTLQSADETSDECYIRFFKDGSFMDIGVSPVVSEDLSGGEIYNSTEEYNFYTIQTGAGNSFCSRFELDDECFSYVLGYSTVLGDQVISEGLNGINEIEGMSGIARIGIPSAKEDDRENILDAFTEFVKSVKVESVY